MKHSWQEIEDRLRPYREGFVETFLEYKGVTLEDRSPSGRPVKVNQKNFAEHFGIPSSTFNDWVRAFTVDDKVQPVSGPTSSTPSTKERHLKVVASNPDPDPPEVIEGEIVENLIPVDKAILQLRNDHNYTIKQIAKTLHISDRTVAKVVHPQKLSEMYPERSIACGLTPVKEVIDQVDSQLDHLFVTKVYRIGERDLRKLKKVLEKYLSKIDTYEGVS